MPLSVTLTNPAEVASLASQVAVRTIGRRLTDEESAQLAQAYNALERQYQEQKYAQAGSGVAAEATGGTLVAPPSASTFTEQQLREQHPEEVTLNSADQGFQTFLNLLDSSRARYKAVLNG
jgi:hypothetical protein